MNKRMKSNTAEATPYLVMVREYARGSGAYVRTNLIIHMNGRRIELTDLKPSDIGKLTKAGVEKV